MIVLPGYASAGVGDAAERPLTGDPTFDGLCEALLQPAGKLALARPQLLMKKSVDVTLGSLFTLVNSPQLTAFLTRALILASSAGVSSFSAKEVGHMAPSSRFAVSLKPKVAYLALNLAALWKKQTILPSLA